MAGQYLVEVEEALEGVAAAFRPVGGGHRQAFRRAGHKGQEVGQEVGQGHRGADLGHQDTAVAGVSADPGVEAGIFFSLKSCLMIFSKVSEGTYLNTAFHCGLHYLKNKYEIYIFRYIAFISYINIMILFFVMS